MTTNEMKQLQSIYMQLGDIAKNIPSADGECDGDDVRVKKCLEEARESIMDSVMISIEHAFDHGMLFISNYQ